MLEPYDGKLSRTVLRGEEGRKPLALPGLTREPNDNSGATLSTMWHGERTPAEPRNPTICL